MKSKYLYKNKLGIERLFQLRLNSNLKVVALGDSSVFGVGDIGEKSPDQGYGWAARLSHDLQAKRFVNLAANGMRAKDVEISQLPAALAMKPDLALICVGGNDALRNNFDAINVALSLIKIIESLEKQGAFVVILSLHDPSKITPAPSAVKRVLMERVLQINCAIDWVASKTNVFVVQTISRENIYDKKNWHVDRMHPSAIGHQLIADIVRRELSLPRRSTEKLPTKSDESKSTVTFWLITNAIKWLARRSIDLFPALIYLLLKDLLTSKNRSIEYVTRIKLYLEYVFIDMLEQKLKVLRQTIINDIKTEFKLDFVKFTENKTNV